MDMFISKCSDICHPFFRALKKYKIFPRDENCNKVLANLNAYLSNMPLILIHEPYEQLFVYLSYSAKTVSAALIREDKGV